MPSVVRVESRRLPAVDVIVSTYNEGAYIGRCLEQILGQDYPAELMTVWLVDGGSTDQTVAIATSWAARDNRLRILGTSRRLNLPEALNVALAEASGEVVAKIDAHGYPETSFISRAVAALLSGGETLGCVGGRPVQEGETRFGEAVARVRGSRVGVGGSGYGSTTEHQYVATVQCGVYRRAALDQIGWFDPAMNFGEDDELNWRLTKRGFRILLDTRIQFHYVTRPTWCAAYRQYRNYGRARVMVVQKHPDYLRLYHLAPAGFVLTLLTLTTAALFSTPARYTLLLTGSTYLAILVLESVRISRARLVFVPPMVAAFIALHMGYGIGMIQGLMRLRPEGLRARYLRH